MTHHIWIFMASFYSDQSVDKRSTFIFQRYSIVYSLNFDRIRLNLYLDYVVVVLLWRDKGLQHMCVKFLSLKYANCKKVMQARAG